jgi:hypothetical protein
MIRLPELEPIEEPQGAVSVWGVDRFQFIVKFSSVA